MLMWAGTVTAETSYQAVTVAKEHFAQQRFSEGRGVLLGRLRTPTISLGEKSSIFSALGDFYCHDVGNYKQGLDYYQKAVGFNPDNPIASPQIEFIQSQQEKNRQVDQVITDISTTVNRARVDDDDGTKDKIQFLQTVAESRPDYYRLAEVFYYLGTYHAAGGRELKAIDYFERARQVKPGIDFMASVSEQIPVLRSRWRREVATAISTGVLAGMFLLAAVLFYATRPWQWLKLRQIAALLLLNSLLCIVFLAIYKGMSRTYAASDEAGKVVSEGAVYLYTSINSPGFKIFAVFMIYLVIGLGLISVFALSIGRLIKNKPAAAIVSGIGGAVMMVSLLGACYMQHFEPILDNTPELSVNGLLNPSKALVFSVEGIEPYILTDPEAFPNLDVGHRTNPYLEKWAEQYCPFDESETTGEK